MRKTLAFAVIRSDGRGGEFIDGTSITAISAKYCELLAAERDATYPKIGEEHKVKRIVTVKIEEIGKPEKVF